MFFLVLRIIIAPLVVVGGTFVQRRFGHVVSGLVIGLPLTSLPLLWLVAIQHGTLFARSMSSASLVGCVAEIVMIWTYATLARRLSPTRTLLASLAVFTLTAGVIDLFTFSALLGGLLAAGGFAIALRFWPTTIDEPVEGSGRYRLTLRAVLAAGFSFLVITMAGRIGPGLSGLAEALPIMSLVIAFITHQEIGAHATSRFLQGVVKGSFSYVASNLVFTELMASGPIWIAILVALGVAGTAQVAVQYLDSWPGFKRVISYSFFSARVSLES
jgi:hypothetical protein